MDDQKLAEACARGDKRAQRQLYDQYSRQIMGVCLRYGNDYDEAQDLFQEGFVKVFNKIHLYNGKGALGAWIRRTVVNNSLDHLRKTRRERNQVRLYNVEYKLGEDEADNPLDEEEPLISADRLAEMIAEMPTGYRTVFNLFAVEEYPHKEIAEKLGISESTSKTQYHKAKAFLRKMIKEELKTVGE